MIQLTAFSPLNDSKSRRLLTDVFNLRYSVVADVEGVQLLARLQVLDVFDQVLLKVEAAEVRLRVESLYLINAIALEPQALQTGVFLQIFDFCNT